MQLNITEKKENPFFKRIEVKASLIFDKQTPSNNEVAQAVAKAVGCEAGNVVVKRIATAFGSTTALVEALAYKDKTSLDSCEPITSHIKKKRAEQAKKASAETA